VVLSVAKLKSTLDTEDAGNNTRTNDGSKASAGHITVSGSLGALTANVE
jgi:hypothetical protein